MRRGVSAAEDVLRLVSDYWHWRRSISPRSKAPMQRRAAPPAVGTSVPTPSESPMLGYVIIPSGTGTVQREDVERQTAVVARECELRGWAMTELVRDLEPYRQPAVKRPGLTYALAQLDAGHAAGLVVGQLSALSRSVADLEDVLVWFAGSEARLVVVDPPLDTFTTAGRAAAHALLAAARWERERLATRTRKGLEAARASGRVGRQPAVADDPELRERIATMRERGMTLQAIADQLNAEGVPTVRGGAKWRPSSVQLAAGYKRPAAAPVTPLRDDTRPSIVRAGLDQAEARS